MKRAMKTILLAAACVALLVPAWAAGGDDEVEWSIHGQVRARADALENYDYNDAIDDNINFWPYTLKLGVEATFGDNVRGMIEVRNDSVFGGSPTGNEWVVFPEIPFSGTSPYYGFDQNDDVDVYQAFVEVNNVGGSKFGFTIGRQEYTLANELLLGDNDFYTGQSYDGARVGWNTDRWGVEGFFFKIEELNVNPDAFSFTSEALDTDLGGGTAHYTFDGFGTINVYYLTYLHHDDGFTAKTVGAQWGKKVEQKDDGMFDWSIEYASQSGDYDDGTVDLAGDVIEGWFGFNLWTGDLHHRFHVGYLNASGDDPDTADDETFYSMFTDPHAYNRLGNLDMFQVSDIEDINLGYHLMFGQDQNQRLCATLHMLALDQPQDIGGGVMEDDLGMAWDVNYQYRMNQYLAFEANVSVGQSGDLQDAFAGSDSTDARRYYGQVNLTW